MSLTTTLFFDVRLEENTQFIFDPEIAGGKGFSNVDGIADPPNGEIPRVASATPKPYLARLLISHDFGFGAETEHVESDENQLAGDRPMTRYSIYAGRFTVTDYFDNNAYTHDPREQFMAWGVMYNGAWDYPADTRGYTWGIVQEFNTRKWALRYGIAAEPKVANGSQFDRRLFRDHGQVWEAERRWSFDQGKPRDGAVRVLGYANRAQAGNYAEALKLAEETAHHASRRRHAARRHIEVWNRHQPGSGHHLRFRLSSRAWAGTTGRPRASPSPPSIVWRAAAFRSKARAGIARTMWSRLRSPPADFPASTPIIWRTAAWIS